MSNLIPEKRLDKNGVLTTKHVRAMPKQAAGKSSLPAPSAGAKQPTKKKFKPRPRQLEQNHHSHIMNNYPADSPLRPKSAQDWHNLGPLRTSFFASDVEVYEVLSATTSSGNALEMLIKGVRTADEARAYMREHRAGHLVADRSDLMNEALERGIPTDSFLGIYENMNEIDRQSPFVLDAIELRASSFHQGFNTFVADEVISGKVAYSDLKAIGLGRLKPHGRGFELIGLLTKLNEGNADYTVDDLKDFVLRAAEAKTDQEEFGHACKLAYAKGLDLLQEPESFEIANREYFYFMRPASHWHRQNSDEDPDVLINRVEYGVRLGLGTTSRMNTGASSPYFEAGVPVEVAIDTINGGGGLRQAIAIHEGGVEKSMSSGWL